MPAAQKQVCRNGLHNMCWPTQSQALFEAFRLQKLFNLMSNEEKRRLKELRNLRILFAGAVLVVVIICGFGYWIYQNNIKTRNELAKSYWDKSRTANEVNNSLAALYYTAEALSTS